MCARTLWSIRNAAPRLGTLHSMSTAWEVDELLIKMQQLRAAPLDEFVSQIERWTAVASDELEDFIADLIAQVEATREK